MVASKYLTPIGMIIVAVVALGVGLVASPILFPPARGADPIWDNIVKRGSIRVGSSPDWPPYESLNLTSGEFIGFEVELMETIADRLDLTVEWKEMGFDLIIPEIKKGVTSTIDVGVSGFSVREDRLAEVQFVMYHSITEGQIVMLKSRRDALGITEISSIEELDDLSLTCGAQEGTTQLLELNEKAPGAATTYADYIVALEDLNRGAIDAIYAETPITTEWISEAEGTSAPLVIIYRRTYYPVAFLTNKDAHTLVEKINSMLAEMIGNGEVEAIRKKWNA